MPTAGRLPKGQNAMISFPHAKINLGLQVKTRREDGYHEIETVLYPIQWRDALEAIPSHVFSFAGEAASWGTNDDLCVKAFRLLEREAGAAPVKMMLLKTIPAGAGLGGGSSDAAATLKAINNLQHLGIPEDRLHHLASEIGADCPFFLQHQPKLATGTGTTLDEIGLNLAGLHLVVVVPDVRIETGWAYANVVPRQPQLPLRDVICEPVATWRQHLRNDFEEVVFISFPQVAKVKAEMYAAGAIYASMSGSGSAVFGLFDQQPALDAFRALGTIHSEAIVHRQ